MKLCHVPEKTSADGVDEGVSYYLSSGLILKHKKCGSFFYGAPKARRNCGNYRCVPVVKYPFSKDEYFIVSLVLHL